MTQGSLEKLSTCHEHLQELIKKVDEIYPLMVLEGHRNKDKQEKYFNEGKSKLHWPHGEHNQLPSRAVDIAYLPICWDDKREWYFFSGVVFATAKHLGIKVRWGGDFNRDMNFNNDSFLDLVHWELEE